MIEEACDVRIEYPVHSPVANRYIQSIECLMLAATWSETITETEKILLSFISVVLSETLTDRS